MLKNAIWICGANGRLGSALQRHLDPIDVEILATDIDTVDVTNNEEVILFAQRNRPRVIINCAAITDPEECEKDPSNAFRVNGLGARNVAVAADYINAKLVHLSTDDIFDMCLDKPYKEYDEPSPSTIYGQSKLLGEKYIQSLCRYYFIIRSSWLYSVENQMVEEIISCANNNKDIIVAKNQKGSPTSAYELARFIIELIKTHEYGIIHASCAQVTTRREFAQTILDLVGKSGNIIEVDDHRCNIYHPDYAVLDNFILRISKLYNFPHWKEAVQQYINTNHLK